MSDITVSIAGVTSKFAQFIIAELLAKPNVTIHGIARDPSKVAEKISSNPRVKIFQASGDETDKLRAAVRGTSITICCYFGGDNVMVDGQKTLIDACIAESVPRYLASEWSFDYRGFKLGDVPHKDFEIHIANYLEEKAKQIRGVHVLCGAFTEVIFSPFLHAYDGKALTWKTWGSGDEKLEVTSWLDAAKYTAAIAVDDQMDGFINVLADSVSPKELVQIYDKVYGQKLNLQIEGSHKDLEVEVHSRFEREPQNMFSWYGLWLYLYCINGTTNLGTLVNDRFDVKPKTLEEFLQSNDRESLPNLMH